jgi:hypothetical protein
MTGNYAGMAVSRLKPWEPGMLHVARGLIQS